MNADPHGMNRPGDAPWLTYLEQERPNHPRQLAVHAQIERAAWERTKAQRAWRDDLRRELRQQGHNA